ncbi:hypothetical protein [Actinoplanes sp. CA-252034]|uniref:hypothetical protein n=1 Tax=Actinoplanes sp. CA-252034 TaxID=3239906 RepID=UPI003D95B5B6
MADQPDESSSGRRRADVEVRFLSPTRVGAPADRTAEDARPHPSTAPEFRLRSFTGTLPASGRPTVPLPARPPVAPPTADAPAVPASGNAPALPYSVAEDGMPVAGRPAGSPPTARPARSGSPAGRSLLGRRPPPADAGRVVLIYEQQIKRPWRLLGFTAVLVSLTVGVVLGQTTAYRPPASRPVATVQADAPTPQTSGPLPPPVPLTAPLGAVEKRRLEITGTATTLRVRTAALGDSLFTIVSLDPNAAPRLTEIGDGSLLTLTSGAEVVLNSTVAWTLRLTGGASELDVDVRAGGLAGFDLAGGVARGVLRLPRPRGTVPLTVTGTTGELIVRTEARAPVRVRLDKGAGLVTVNGRARRDVKPGSTLRETGWAAAAGRYDIRIRAEAKSVLVERATPAG